MDFGFEFGSAINLISHFRKVTETFWALHSPLGNGSSCTLPELWGLHELLCVKHLAQYLASSSYSAVNGMDRRYHCWLMSNQDHEPCWLLSLRLLHEWEALRPAASSGIRFSGSLRPYHILCYTSSFTDSDKAGNVSRPPDLPWSLSASFLGLLCKAL